MKHDDPRLKCIPKTIKDELRELRDPREADAMEQLDCYQFVSHALQEQQRWSYNFRSDLFKKELLPRPLMNGIRKRARRSTLRKVLDKRERIISQRQS